MYIQYVILSISVIVLASHCSEEAWHQPGGMGAVLTAMILNDDDIVILMVYKIT